jgi:hypothetical protein
LIASVFQGCIVHPGLSGWVASRICLRIGGCVSLVASYS